MNKSRWCPLYAAAFAAACLPPIAGCARSGGDGSTATTAPDAAAVVAVSDASSNGPTDIPPAVEAFADVRGVHMRYLRQGSPNAPKLVLLEGGGSSVERSWSVALPFFARSFDVIAPDRVGQGKTPDVPTRALDYHETAEDTVALLASLGIDHASFVGHSDGGNEALDIAMHHPSLATKIVTAGANFAPDGLTREAIAMINEPPAPDAAAPTPLDVKLHTLWTTEPKWTTADLSKITCPTLVTAGDHDLIRTEHTVQLQKAIPHAELAIFPGAGHSVPHDDAAHWDDTVLIFLEKTAKIAR